MYFLVRQLNSHSLIVLQYLLVPGAFVKQLFLLPCLECSIAIGNYIKSQWNIIKLGPKFIIPWYNKRFQFETRKT